MAIKWTIDMDVFFVNCFSIKPFCSFWKGFVMGVQSVCRRDWTACVSGFRIKVIVLIIVRFKDLMFLLQCQLLKMGLAKSGVFPVEL